MHLEGETHRLCPLMQIHCLILSHYFKVTTKDTPSQIKLFFNSHCTTCRVLYPHKSQEKWMCFIYVSLN